MLECLSKDLITVMIGSRLSLANEKDLGFGTFNVGTRLEKSLLNISKSSSSLDMILLSSVRLIFSPFNDFWVNNVRADL